MKHDILTKILLLCLLFFPVNVFGKIKDAGNYLEKNVVVKKLNNGITLIMLNRGYSPTLAFEIAFRVGSTDETYRTAGAAHLLEHMLFKGTDRIGTKDFKKEKVLLDKIEAVGITLDRLKVAGSKNPLIPDLEKKLKKLQKQHGKLVISSPYDKIYTSNGGVGFNASTSRDKTGYYVQLPSSRLELWARLESERLLKPVFREYFLERKNVIEERLMRYDSVGSGSLYERFLAAAYQAHPYRHPIIGWRSNIPFLSITDVKNFYWKYYIPSRMTITIVGKQDVNKTYAIIKKYFERIKSRPGPSEIPVKEPPMLGELRFKHYFESNPHMMIGWHKPTYPEKDDYVFDIISGILASGKTSRLYKSLVLEKKLFSSINAWNGSPGARYNNMFVIFAAPKLNIDPLKAENEIYNEIENFAGNVLEKDITKVINKMESRLVFDLDSNRGLAHSLSYYQTIFNDWKYSFEYIKELKKITTDDIKKAVKKYLTKKNRVVGILYDSRKTK